MKCWAFSLFLLVLGTVTLAACASPQPLPQAPTPIPTLAPATLPPSATLGSQTPQAAANAGADIFSQNCSPCHNLTAARKVGPGLKGLFRLPNLPNGQPVTDANLGTWIHTGDSLMPAIPLPDADVTTLIAFLKEATK
jgi:cytochrome c